MKLKIVIIALEIRKNRFNKNKTQFYCEINTSKYDKYN